jgi:hypothetical protein
MLGLITSAPARPCIVIRRGTDHYHIPVRDDSIESIEIEGVEYRRTLWQDMHGYPIFTIEDHNLLLHPPGARRPTLSDEQIDEHWRRVDSGELTLREFGEAMATHNVDILRLRRRGETVNPDTRVRGGQGIFCIQVLCLIALLTAIGWRLLYDL